MSKADVEEAQALLGTRVDGIFGPNDLKALKAALKVPVVSDMPDPELISALKRDEGLRLTAYKDTVGVWTVGYGHAHIAPGTVWNQGKAEQMLIEDVKKHNAELLEKLPWVAGLDRVRQNVLFNMGFNLGINGLLGFKNTLEAVRTGRYNDAASGMLKSLWAKQVKGRAVRLAQEMQTGRIG